MNRLITDCWAQDCNFPARALELRECLRENGNVHWLDQLVLFCRDTKAAKVFAGELGLPEAKVCFVPADNRITYQQSFDHVNQMTGPKDVNILANCDISFEDTSCADLPRFVRPHTFFCLTRWNGSELDPHMRYSQDTWVWQGQCRIANAHFSMGVPRCDHVIARRALDAGYQVFNPALNFITRHHHKTGYRTYAPEDKVSGPGHYADVVRLAIKQ